MYHKKGPLISLVRVLGSLPNWLWFKLWSCHLPSVEGYFPHMRATIIEKIHIIRKACLTPPLKTATDLTEPKVVLSVLI